MSAIPGPRLAVVADAGELRRTFREQNAWFASMALILTVSMVIDPAAAGGASVRAGTRRSTRNFVASVTHELRTPIAAVKLYGEMLRDGWVSDDARRDEYLGRIVTESDRLGGWSTACSSADGSTIVPRRHSPVISTPRSLACAATSRSWAAAR